MSTEHRYRITSQRAIEAARNGMYSLVATLAAGGFGRRTSRCTDIASARAVVGYTALIPAWSAPARRVSMPNASTGPSVPLRWRRPSAARIAPHARIAAVKS